MQDTATQAMTEVALGLSMAFFALLILALISVSLPATQEFQEEPHAVFEVDQKINISAESDANNQQRENESTVSNLQIEQDVLLFWQGHYYDLDLNKVTVEEFVAEFRQKNQANELIVAVKPSLALNELLNIQNSFEGLPVQITMLSEQWQQTLSTQSNSLH